MAAPLLCSHRDRVFTQEDPIGLAGGLNLYGYANGDPVNFSDPFGLCPQGLSGRQLFLCNLIEAAFTALGADIGGSFGAGAGLVLALPTGELAAPITVPAGAVAGAIAGGVAGNAVGQAVTNVLFSERGDGGGLRRKPGSQGQFKGRDALRRERDQVRDVVRELGLDKDQRQQLHRAISGRGLDYHQIREEALGMFPR